MEQIPYRILLVEDNPGDARLVQEYLSESEAMECTLGVAASLAEGLKALAAKSFDLVLADLGLPDSQGIDTFHRLSQAAPNTPLIILTGLNDPTLAIESLREGGQDFLLKSEINPHSLGLALRFAIERWQSRKALQDSEEKFAKAFYHSPVWVVIRDSATYEYLEVNDAFLQAMGYTRAEVIGKRTLEQSSWVNQQERAHIFSAMREHVSVRNLEVVRRNKKGQDISTLYSGGPLEVNGRPSFIAVSQDITAQKMAQEGLKSSREEIDALLQNISAGVVVYAPDTTVLACNREASRLLGLSLEQLQGKKAVDPVWAFLREDGTEMPIKEHPINQVLDSGKDLFDYVMGIRRHDRKEVTWVLLNARIIPDERGRISQVINTFVNINERRKIQNELKQERDLSQQYLDTAGVILLVLDRRGHIILINRKGCEVMGCENEEVLGQDWFDNYIPEDDRQRVRGIHNINISGAMEPHAYEEGYVITGLGERRLIRWFNSAVKDSDGNITGTLSSGEDITELKAAHEAINRLAAIVESSQDAITGKDLEGIITSWNYSAERIYGYTAEEAIGRHISLLVPEDREAEIEQILTAVKRGEPKRIYETVRRRKDGSLVDVSLSISPVNDEKGEIVGVATIAHEITEIKKEREKREKLETQLRQAQKMEAVGTLAGGIAHDFNNILAAIMGYTELAYNDLPPDSEVAVHVKTALDAAKRAKELTCQILSFSRQSDHKRVSLALETVIKDILKMLRATLPSTIELKLSLPAGTGEIMADPVQIQQVLINLCTNAAQAMDESGGVLSVSLDEMNLDEPAVGEYADLAAGKYLCLSVGDTGVGMTKDVLERIFDPFFTTKTVGKGTGMGLSVVHGIVKEYDGAITVHSEPGQGTTFHVYLPQINGHSSKEPPSSSRELPRGNESILFVDDEPAIVDIGKKALSRLGYNVKGFTSAREAFEALKAAPDDFDLLITDLTMPKMTGVQLATEVSAIKPGMPIIMCTGFSERLNIAASQEINVSRLVMKPLMPREIAQIVRELLDINNDS